MSTTEMLTGDLFVSAMEALRLPLYLQSRAVAYLLVDETPGVIGAILLWMCPRYLTMWGGGMELHTHRSMSLMEHQMTIPDSCVC